MNDLYRVPDIKEFVQGFEFERLDECKTKLVFIDATTKFDASDDSDWNITTSWIPVKVWWKHNPDEIITEIDKDGNTYTSKGSFINFFAPYDDATIKRWINEGKIRTKINV